MIVVTGGAGFIGSQLVKSLNREGHRNVVVVDDLTDGRKFHHLVGCDLLDYCDFEEFLKALQNKAVWTRSIITVFHQGACSTTTEWNGRYMMKNNYDYSKEVFHFCQNHNIPLIYASSAAIYGKGSIFRESCENEQPLNVYGYSKYLFDRYVTRHRNHRSPVVGLRYFNVYGPNESHKGSMASVAFHILNQLSSSERLKLFESFEGYEAGEQKRDFIYIDDIVKVNLWFMKHSEHSGIFNVGTGRARTFNELARILIKLHGYGTIEYVPFPESLKGTYQSCTEADVSALRNVGYQENFIPLEEGLRRYFEYYRTATRIPTLLDS